MSDQQKFHVPINLMNQELRNARLQEFATLPAGIARQFGYDATAGSPVYNDGSGWRILDPLKATGIPIANLAVNPLARANHTGTQLAATISDFDTAVRTNRLDQMAAPTAAVSFNGQRITAVAAPTTDTDAVNRGWVNTQLQSLEAGGALQLVNPRDFSITGVVSAASVSFNGTANVVLNTSIADGALTIAKTSGLQAALNAKINTTSIGAANGVAPLDAQSKIASQYLPSYVDDVVEVANYAGLPGTGESGKLYLTIDTGKVYRWSGSAYIIVSDAVSTADSAVKLATARAFSLTGIVTASAVNFDGTGNVALATAIADNALSIAKTSGLQPALNAKAGRYSVTVGNGTLSEFTITHSLNTEDISVTVRNATTKEIEYAGITILTVNTCKVKFLSGPPDANSIRVTVIG